MSKHVKNILLHQNNFLAHLLCHVTYITTFNKCSDLDLNPADLLFFIILARHSQQRKIYRPAANIFKYFYLLDIKIGFPRLGVGLLNSTFKTTYLRWKSKLFSLSQMSMLVNQAKNNLNNTQIS